MEDDAAAELAPPRPLDLLQMREPEGDEEQARLVDVPVAAIDDVDLGLVLPESAAAGWRSSCRPSPRRG